ncbi:Fatty acid desaturase [Pseudomonas sp. IT-232MI5]|uniref:fatty acid desaturase family protein n=1 Tax=unclassified Pseudomonas TaxID=196821 RepID=UPI000BA3EA6D|nr:fatty acid desaturase [Pseudomonas sp. Irchel 3H7]
MQRTTFTNANRLALADIQSRSSDVTFALKFAIYLALIVTGGCLALSGHPWEIAIGVILLGSMFAHGVELQHQVLHSQGFRNKKLNELFGILLGLPMLVSFADYKASHMHHHRYLGTPENREFFDYGDQYGELSLRSISALLTRLLMVSHYPRFFKNVFIAFSSQYQNVSSNVSKRIKRDHLSMVLMIALLGLVSFQFGYEIIVYLWIIPLMFVAAPVHALIEMPEHFRCATDSTDPYENTRTIKSNAFMNWFTNGNNYHVEHHLMPGLPIDRLHDLHEKIHENCRYLEVSYKSFYLGLLRSMRKS